MQPWVQGQRLWALPHSSQFPLLIQAYTAGREAKPSSYLPLSPPCPVSLTLQGLADFSQLRFSHLLMPTLGTFQKALTLPDFNSDSTTLLREQRSHGWGWHTRHLYLVPCPHSAAFQSSRQLPLAEPQHGELWPSCLLRVLPQEVDWQISWQGTCLQGNSTTRNGVGR